MATYVVISQLSVFSTQRFVIVAVIISVYNAISPEDVTYRLTIPLVLYICIIVGDGIFLVCLNSRIFK